jgi:NhaA family Na+:H+ antiporter
VADPLPDDRDDLFPREPVDALVGPLQRFFHVEASGGVVLLAATALALVLANSPLSEPFLALWQKKLSIGLGDFQMSHSFKHWISDGLMAVFFFVIGLEVKRELVLGELRDLRKAALPIAGAVGGMLAPAAIYLSLQWGEPSARGWGIPMATDIAFVVGCMAVLGPRVPAGLRVMLLSLAIADDIGAILVIAFGYTESLAWGWLLFGLGGIAAIRVLAQVGVRSVSLYVLVGAGVWLGFHESGVHATIAGVILGLMTPARSWIVGERLRNIWRVADRYVHGERWETPAERREVLRKLEMSMREALSPLERLETALHPWQSFLIVPLFALVNAGVAFQLSDLADPVALAVMLGLVAGKPLGIVAVSWLAVRSGLARLPDGVSWGAVAGGGCLAGIGFTMALFIAGLALPGPELAAAKVGILSGSAVSALLGMALLLALLPRPARAAA